MNSLGNLPVNWFDLFVVLFLVAGAIRGRKNGMSQEFLPLLMWVSIVVVCGLFYQPLASAMADFMVLSMLWASVLSYLTLAVLVVALFALVKRQLGGKIIGSDMFGKSEYYLGIVSGMVRFACILIFGLSLLNARLYTQKEIDAMYRFQQQNFDSNFFPTFYTVQHDVMKLSFCGPVVHDGLEFLLIKPCISENKELRRREYSVPM